MAFLVKDQRPARGERVPGRNAEVIEHSLGARRRYFEHRPLIVQMECTRVYSAGRGGAI